MANGSHSLTSIPLNYVEPGMAGVWGVPDDMGFHSRHSGRGKFRLGRWTRVVDQRYD